MQYGEAKGCRMSSDPRRCALQAIYPMKKIEEKRAMKLRIFAMLIFGGLIALSSPTGFAQETMIKANIPFNFYAGNKVMPAGEYTLKRGASNQPGLLLIRSVDNRNSTFVMTQNANDNVAARETDLMFNKINDQYFLSKITVEGDDDATTLRETKYERQLEHTLAQNGVPKDQMISMVKIAAY
jgi:hypothetical protein